MKYLIAASLLLALGRAQATPTAGSDDAGACRAKLAPYIQNANRIVETRSAEFALTFAEIPNNFCASADVLSEALGDNAKKISDARKLKIQALGLKIAGVNLRGRTLEPLA